MAGSDGAMALNTPHVLVAAGSDSSGGAGIARDIETVAAFGLRACLAVTAVTVQTHTAATRVETCAAGLVEEQMRAALETNRVLAIKIGMLGERDVVGCVASVLAAHGSVPAVLDPVIAASSGRPLLSGDALDLLRGALMPLCSLLTPNLPELAILAEGPPARDEAEIHTQARRLLDAGAPAILVKGGHRPGHRAVDVLIRRGEAPLRFDGPRLTGTMRGTGCMLASAIAAGLARGKGLEESIKAAKTHVAERWDGV